MSRLLTGATVPAFLLSAQSAYAASGDVISATPLSGSGGVCTISVTYDVAGTDADWMLSGSGVDSYRVKAVAPTGTNGIGNPHLDNAFQDFTLNRYTRNISLSASDIAGTPLANAGPSATLDVVLEDTTGRDPNLVDGPFEGRRSITLSTLRSSGSNACLQVAQAISPNGTPTADAGPDQSPTIADYTAASNMITLDATGSSDPDGDPLTYQWTQVSGPSVTLSSATAAQPTFTLAPTSSVQTLEFEVVASDGSATASDRVLITIPAAASTNQAPIITASASPSSVTLPEVPPARGFIPPSVSLDASGSSDPDGDPLTFVWTQIRGTAQTLFNANTSVARFTPGGITADENLEFEVSVSDGNLTTTQGEAVFINIDQQPTAMTGSDRTVNTRPGQTFVVDASNSSDPEGATLTYEWVQLSGPAVNDSSGNPTTLGNVLGTQVSLSLQPPSNLTTQQQVVFEVRVSDGFNAPATDTVTLQLRPAANQAPTADAGADQALGNIQPGDTAQLDGTGSTDPDGNTPLTYSWVQTAGTSVTFDDPTLSQPTVTLPGGLTGAQSFTFELTVTDSLGLPSAVDTIVLSGTYPASLNTAPVADAGQDIVEPNYVSGTNIRLDASNSTDADGGPLTYAWRQVAGPQAFLGSANTVSPTVSLNTSGLSGTQTLVFEVTVSDGAASDTDRVTLELTPDPSATSSLVATTPVITGFVNAGFNDECQITGSFSVTGATNDFNGEDTYEVRLTNGNDGARLDRGQAGSVAVGTTKSDSLQARLRSVTVGDAVATGQLFFNVFDTTVDASGSVITGQRVARQRVDLNAMAAAGGICANLAGRIQGTNGAPFADAGPDQSFQNVRTAQTVTLDGTGSTDPENDTLTYQWTQVAGTFVTLSSTTAASPTFSFLPTQAETLIFELVVSDGNSISSADRVEIAFTPFINGVPTTNAGPDQTIVVPPNGQTVQLDGSATSDPDGDPLTFAWVQVSGPTVTLSDPAIVNPTFATPAVTADTALVFRLTGDDGTDSSADEVTINLDLNETPVADAGPAVQATLNPAGQTVQLDASGSTDPEGDTLTYSWTQVSGTPVTLSGAATATPTFTVPAGAADGDTAVFEVEVSDGLTRSTAQVTVTYVTNGTPVADAGTDVNIVVPPENRTVTLTAAASTDPEGDTLTYQWTQVSGPVVTLDDATSVTPSFTLPAGVVSGTYAFEVEVSDGNSSSTDQVQVIVVRNDAPTADAGADQAINLPPGGQTVTLDGSASSDPENDTLAYSWVQLAGPIVTLSDPNVVSPTFTVPAGVKDADDFRFQLTVTDGRNPDAVDEVVIDIIVDDPPIADAGADQSLDNPADGQTIVLDGSGSSDPEGQALTYSWTQVSGRTVTLVDANTVTPEFAYDATNAPARESFVFELTVSDGTNSSVADSVTIDVVNNTAPVADAGADQTNVNADQTVTLDATGSSDPDGDTLSYSWTQVSGPTVTLSGANTATPTFTAPDVSVATDLVFEVTVDDGDLTDTDRVTVGIQPVGSITIVQLTQGGDISVPFTSTLSQLSGPIQTVNGVGQRVATRVGQGTYTVRATDVRDLGFALTSLTCSDGDSTTDVETGLATIALAPGEDVVCTFSSVNSRGAAQAEIRKYLGARNALLLSSGPDRQRRLDRLNGVAASGGANAYGFQLPGASYMPGHVSVSDGNVAFSTSLSMVDGARRKTDAGRGMGDVSAPGSYDVWVEGTFADVDIAGRDGGFGVVHGGADMRIGENVLLGAMLSLDSFKVDGDASGIGEGDGDGYLVGPYVTARIAPNLYVDARVAYGESDNSISALGTFTDEFETSRFFTDAAVFGEWEVSEKLNIRPLVGIRYLEEDQKEYVDSLGVTIPGQTVDMGELSFAPRFQTVMPVSANWTLRPYAEVEGIYAFGDEIEDVLGSETRLRTELGTDIVSLSGVRGGVSVFADGIGADDFGSQGVRVRVGWSFR